MMNVLDEAGFTSVLGDQLRPDLRPHPAPRRAGHDGHRLESVVGPKRTGVGAGYFVTTRNTWRVGDETVAR